MIKYDFQPFPEQQGVNIRVFADMKGGDMPVDYDDIPNSERQFDSYDSFHAWELEPLLKMVKQYLKGGLTPVGHINAYVGRMAMGMFPVKALEQSLEFVSYEDVSFKHPESGETLQGLFAEDPDNPGYVLFIHKIIDTDENFRPYDEALPEEVDCILPAIAVHKDSLESFEQIIAQAQHALAGAAH